MRKVLRGGCVLKLSRFQTSRIQSLCPWKVVEGTPCGNAIWRSPESWCRSRQNQASDVFSFGIVVRSPMPLPLLLQIANTLADDIRDGQRNGLPRSDDQLRAADSWRHILLRHISYFANQDDLSGFLEHTGVENPFYERLIYLTSGFGPGNPMQPFRYWDYMEPDLRDLVGKVGKMTRLDPTRRITARDALQHRWFSVPCSRHVVTALPFSSESFTPAKRCIADIKFSAL